MPKINIQLNDNTGAEYSSNAQVVFIPGILKVAGIDGYKLDDNKCIYLAADSVTSTDLKKIFVIDPTEYSNNTRIEQLKATITNAQADIDNKINIKANTDLKTKAEEELKVLEAANDRIIEEAKATSIFVQTCLSKKYDVIYCYTVGEDGLFRMPSLDFLEDKDNYNVKYLTLGVNYPIATEVTKLETDITVKVDVTKLNKMVELCALRNDCISIVSAEYDKDVLVENNIKGDDLALCIQAALEGKAEADGDVKYKIVSEGIFNITNSKYGALLFPNTKTGGAAGFIEGSDKYVGTMPSAFAYLTALGDCMSNNQYWLPVANSARGSLTNLGDTDITATKFRTDKNIIKDRDGISFNTIVNLRPYGNVIWGDRTLLKLDTTVKASGYLSLMGMVCDISKEAYSSAVRYTYDSNNTTTWFNFKTRIVNLLDQIVAAGVLQSYKVSKMPSKEYNKITCKITVFTNLPVENFDIYIDLQNAEVTTSDNEADNA